MASEQPQGHEENQEESPTGIDPELSYEEAYQRLEQVLEALENGELPLEEALTLYELGATLATYCSHKLDEAELRVHQWQPGDQTTTFDAWQESE